MHGIAHLTMRIHALAVMFPLKAAIVPRYLDMILPSMHPVGFLGVMKMRRIRLRWPIWPTAQLDNFIARFRAPLGVVVMKI